MNFLISKKHQESFCRIHSDQGYLKVVVVVSKSDVVDGHDENPHLWKYQTKF